MILCEQDRFLIQAVNLKTRIDVAGEGIDCGPRWEFRKAPEPLHVELRELVRDVHQRTELLRRHLGCSPGEHRRVLLESRASAFESGQGTIIVERLGGRDDG